MNKFYLACIIGFAAFVTVQAQGACSGQPDNRQNPHQFGCYFFRYCFNGTEITENCVNGTVYERDSASCQDPYPVANSACGTTPNCAGNPDGLYGDTVPNCQTFHWCIGGSYLANSRQYCPSTLVWDSANNFCNHAFAVPSPCGTA